MAGISLYPNGDYSPGSTWQNANDRVMYERTFATGTDEQQKVAQAMITQSMSTSIDEIRAKMTMPPPPAALPMMPVAPTLDDVLNVGPKADTVMNHQSPTDFSGTNAGSESTSYPSLNAW